ncbi:MAG: DUF7059 domain-containing protein [Micrococcaceae bacterium]
MSAVPAPARPAPAAGPGAVQLIAELEQDLHEVGYTVDAVAALLGPVALAALDREQAVAAREVVGRLLDASDDPRLAVLVSAWMLGDPVPVAMLDAALPRTRAAGAERLHLGQVRDGTFHPSVDLSPYSTDVTGDLWVASDQTALQLRSALPDDHVLGIGGASLTLAGVTVRRRVARALDVGVGCGVQTLHLLAHAEHVTATDLSERALEFTRFNLLLNAPRLGVDRERLDERVTLVQGDLLDPVAGEKFDLVVSNPPFVIAPLASEHLHTYRETGREGDALVAELISTVGSVLAPGGTAQLLANWEIPAAAAAWDARPRTWIAASEVPLDAWIIQRDHHDPAGYAELWLQDSSEGLDTPGYLRAYHRYLEDFARRDVAAIGFGYVWLRRAAPSLSAPKVRTEELLHPIAQPLGPAWGEAIETWDLLEEPAAIRELHPVVPFHVTEERHQHFGAEHPEIIMARQGAGFQRSRPVDTALAGLFAAADGELTAGQLLSAVAAILDLDAATAAELETVLVELAVDGYVTFGTSEPGGGVD